MSKDTKSASPLSLTIPHLTTESLDVLKVKRSSIKGQITKFTRFLDNFDRDAALTSIQINELTLKLNKFLDLSNRFEVMQTRIEVLNEGNLADELAERDSMEESLHLAIATAQSIIEVCKPKETFHDADQDSSSNSNSHRCHDHDSLGFKLPLIQIHKFDGTFFKWLEFRDTYESLIHKNDRIKAIHKFHYLTSYLEGEAARVISNLEVSADNYSEAWDLLCERYNNNRQLITNHLNSLFSIEPLQRESDKALRYLSDHVTKNLRALKTLGQPTDQWDTIIIHMLTTKLDQATRTKWEEYRNNLVELPSLDEFKKILKSRADVLETLYRSKRDKQVKPQLKSEMPQSKSFAISAIEKTPRPCVVCQGKHRIFDCKVFSSLTTDEKWAQAAKLKLCFNCLRPDHDTARCRLGGCRVCKRRHNTCLHKHTTNTPTSPASVSPSGDNNGGAESSSSSSIVMSAVSSSAVLLCTAIINIVNPQTNKVETVRALIDNGSMSCMMTNDLRQRLQLTSHRSNDNITAVMDIPINIIPERCSALIKSRQSTFVCDLDFVVLPRITQRLPENFISVNHLNIPSSIKLADPTFNQPSQIDVLLGAEVFWAIIGTEKRPLGNNLPTLYNSELGWLIGGRMPTKGKPLNKTISCNFVATQSDTDLNSQLQKFWEYEDFPKHHESKPILTESESHFIQNTTRLENGQFCVRLPLIDTPDCLGDSYFLAKKRFLSLEKRLNQNLEHKKMYSDFLQEYRDLGHLSDSIVERPHTSFFVPHHSVLKSSSESTKLRVVYDASMRTKSGYSINDLQIVGPNIQDSLFNILLRFRHYRYVLSGDIEKQYRQIVMNELDRDLQLILWRENESLPIKTLRLNTVTYGFSSASFLAARCLWQLGEESADSSIKTIIQNDFYCDDLLTGADEESDLLNIKQAVSNSLSRGCFNLRKYRSNSQLLINSELENIQNDSLVLSQSLHTLGLLWNPTQDTLHFNIDDSSASPDKVTKRSVLSTTFKIFDPLGLLTLCTVKPKILLQKLWSLKLDWDTQVPPEIQRAWAHFIDNIKYLKLLTVPRNIFDNSDSPSFIELHSFSDASQAAYGACMYIKATFPSGKQTVNLLCSKSRVTSTRSATTPRLELAAALLASRLASTVSKASRKPIARCTYWSDSSVVLAWINTCPSKLKTYVANRVAAIQELTGSSEWRHVPTALNPADLASRGIDPQHVQSQQLWWHGPSFLLEPEENWPVLNTNHVTHDLPEFKTANPSFLTNVEHKGDALIDFHKYSQLSKFKRVIAYVLRFINIKCKKQCLKGPLSAIELENALTVLVKLSQQQSFPVDLPTLVNNKKLSPKSRLISLAPFVDSQGILRVGGRLGKSRYDFSVKHPILLCSKHTLTKLIFTYEHKRLLHAGPQLMLASVREQFWPIGGRDLARRTARKCVICIRQYGRTMSNIMGNLPSQRVTPGFPFSTIAVDFAGPFMITDRRGRGCKITKCYLCLFICLRFKCVHLEAVSELSKDAFILSLRRFISRRGKPKEIYCDNGKNFVAAAKEINTFFKQNSGPILEFAGDHNIEFKFSPAYAPNFNGYVEAGIKSAKFHIKRILGNTHLTFEELSTLFAQIEAVLNSRPLCPLSSSPKDYAALTPGHFLLGRPLTSLPAPDLTEANIRNLDRFNRLEQIRQHFWQRWQSEYVMELQQRSKWRTRARDLQQGDLVLIKEENQPPMLWRLGRVLKLHTGSDGVPRVADIDTVRGVVRRALNRICLLHDS
ncbi:uncharacterized protein LOC133517094 [Cydia pomonella]|uniref:uncharacterized protein LOC133517094 n=1 Tax=Cydia pomonella TaxID=82600 RepID=UPI002ADE1586|nr:uncharacterized protein LOC133517094 [Cydia pomonella]